MTETLLSPSNVLLFGRVVADLVIAPPAASERSFDVIVDVAVTSPIANLNAVAPAQGGATLQRGMRVLLTGQSPAAQNLVYKVTPSSTPGQFVLVPLKNTKQPDVGDEILVRYGTSAGTTFTMTGANAFTPNPPGAGDNRHGCFPIPRAGLAGQLEGQLDNARNPRFARIYGFSYEGTYYELAAPALFLVHGDGVEASEMRMGGNRRNPSRAPADPSVSGVAAADYEVSDDVRVWSYDKADYTIRMDVLNGMFEQVLLDNFFDDVGTSTRLAGAKVSGAKVAGAKVSGAKVSGAKLSGRWDPSD